MSTPAKIRVRRKKRDFLMKIGFLLFQKSLEMGEKIIGIQKLWRAFAGIFQNLHPYRALVLMKDKVQVKVEVRKSKYQNQSQMLRTFKFFVVYVAWKDSEMENKR